MKNNKLSRPGNITAEIIRNGTEKLLRMKNSNWTASRRQTL